MLRQTHHCQLKSPPPSVQYLFCGSKIQKVIFKLNKFMGVDKNIVLNCIDCLNHWGANAYYMQFTRAEVIFPQHWVGLSQAVSFRYRNITREYDHNRQNVWDSKMDFIIQPVAVIKVTF